MSHVSDINAQRTSLTLLKVFSVSLISNREDLSKGAYNIADGRKGVSCD